MTVAIDQHDTEIQANVEHWRRKPLLRRIYGNFYRDIAKQLCADLSGPTVEIGSGIGNLKSVLPDAITTDLFPNPWLDRTENAYALSFDNNSVANLILFDVWHHLEYPGTALAELGRVLQRGGRLVIFDPAMGLLGRAVYGCFHHEPLGLRRKIDWEAPDDFSAEGATYYAAQGNAQRVFFSAEFEKELRDWKIVRRKRYAALPYVASGGFRGPQLYPEFLYSALSGVDQIAQYLPGVFATRLLVVLEKL